MIQLFQELTNVSKNGQKEYALNEDAFDNFNRLSAELKEDRLKIAMIYFSKHRDGLISYINGHRSQRESIHGRIGDMIVYLTLIDAMITENENNDDAANGRVTK